MNEHVYVIEYTLGDETYQVTDLSHHIFKKGIDWSDVVKECVIAHAEGLSQPIAETIAHDVKLFGKGMELIDKYNERGLSMHIDGKKTNIRTI